MKIENKITMDLFTSSAIKTIEKKIEVDKLAKQKSIKEKIATLELQLNQLEKNEWFDYLEDRQSIGKLQYGLWQEFISNSKNRINFDRYIAKYYFDYLASVAELLNKEGRIQLLKRDNNREYVGGSFFDFTANYPIAFPKLLNFLSNESNLFSVEFLEALLLKLPKKINSKSICAVVSINSHTGSIYCEPDYSRGYDGGYSDYTYWEWTYFVMYENDFNTLKKFDGNISQLIKK